MNDRAILIVDDYRQLVHFLTERLNEEGYSVVSVSTGKEALQVVSKGFYGPILLDIRLPDKSGLEVFEEIKALNPDLPVIFITAHASIDLAIEATRRGAFDFIAKGSDLLKRLSVSVKNAFERLRMTEEIRTLQSRLQGAERFGEFITVSPKLQQLLNTLDAIVNSAVTVLIEGESGTGKELIARAIHARGSRRHGPFVAVNCAGIPETLLESEMFGYEKGAFTGATARRIGRFEAAHKGTLFLDEVGELPKALQAKLLRVLQDHCFERVGGTEPIKVDVRIISATNRDLAAEVKKGNFREDLYYRLAVFPVRLPPLRDRPEDIPVLAQHFLKRFAREEGKALSGFTPAALAALTGYPYPGNVRELENLVRHAVIVARGPEVTHEDIQAAFSSHRVGENTGSREGVPLQERIAKAFPSLEALPTIPELEKAVLQHALNLSSGNVSKVAKALGIGRATLYRWMKELAPTTDKE